MISCDLSYDPVLEAGKLTVQYMYLFPAIGLHSLILRAVLIKFRKEYFDSPFFKLFALDSIISLVQLLLTTVFYRPATYLTFLCSPVSTFLSDQLLILKLLYCLACYCRPAKCSLQIAISLNRMTCVTFPMHHRKFWMNHTSAAMIIALLSPFAVIWNVIISQEKILPLLGGFGIDYDRAVQWASLSQFNFIMLTITIILTVFFNIVTIRQMMNMKTRMVHSERVLCIATMITTLGFFFSAAVQVSFAYFPNILISKTTAYLIQQIVSSEFVCIWSPTVMVMLNRSMRSHVFGKSDTSPISTAPVSA